MGPVSGMQIGPDQGAAARPSRPSDSGCTSLSPAYGASGSCCQTPIPGVRRRVSGAEAVTVVQKIAYDVVLMDVQMPVLDGLEATRRIRRGPLAGPQPWIIAMTAEALSGDEGRCRAAGMDDYVTKPIRVDALVAALDNVTPRRDR